MNRNHIINQIKKKKSFLCIGLDSDIKKLPKHLLTLEDPVFEFNKEIINKTHDLCIAYKPNTAFYECNGTSGWNSLEKTIKYIKEYYPDIFVIADAKRGDIGNTSKMYAQAFFEKLNVDAVTVAPYMGSDSVLPFLEYSNKWVILLALTSNKGAFDFQFLKNNSNVELYKEVLNKSKNWGNLNNLMFVIGATKSENLNEVREIIPNHFLLVPGVGAQGGSLKEVSDYALNNECGLIVNSSRSIIFTEDTSINFGNSSRLKAMEIKDEMTLILSKKGII